MKSATKKIPFRVSPMLATLVDEPFDTPNWIYEEKYDGVRMLAYKEGEKVTLISRNAIDRTARYPAVAAAVGKLKAETLLLDGEVAVFNKKNVSSFQALQQGKGEPEYAIFDCLYRDGEDLRKRPLAERRGELEKVLGGVKIPLLISAIVGENGIKAFQIASKRGYEGIVAKSLASPYVEKRSSSWLKVKAHQEDEFVIGGYTPPSGARKYFGALLIGVYDGDELKYAGKVGTGFDEKLLAELYKKFAALKRAKSPFAENVREKGATFVTPKLVAQLSFTEWTSEGKLRHPVFLGLRDDKKAREVKRAEG
jgi:bifunctional non-homologous end joining protein LigD